MNTVNCLIADHSPLTTHHSPGRKKLISVVTPCYNEGDNVEACFDAVRTVFERELPGYDLEDIFCDNASTDDTADVLRTMAARDQRIKVILNVRNFGPFCSTFNGLMSTTGDAVVVLLAADLQDPPELIPQFVKRWEEGYQVVYGIRKTREESFLMRSIRKVYYRLVSNFAEIHIPPDVRRVSTGGPGHRPNATAVRRPLPIHPWHDRQLRFQSRGCRVHVASAAQRILQEQALPSCRSGAERPCLIHKDSVARVSVLWVCVVGAQHSLRDLQFARTPDSLRTQSSTRHPDVDRCAFFFSGVQLFFFGILGEYIGAIHSQVRRRPLVIEKERINYDCRTVAQNPAPVVPSEDRFAA